MIYSFLRTNKFKTNAFYLSKAFMYVGNIRIINPKQNPNAEELIWVRILKKKFRVAGGSVSAERNVFRKWDELIPSCY